MQMIHPFSTYKENHSRNFPSLYIIIPIKQNKISHPYFCLQQVIISCFSKIPYITAYVAFSLLVFLLKCLPVRSQVFASSSNPTMTSPKMLLSKSPIISSLINSMISFQPPLIWTQQHFALEILSYLASRSLPSFLTPLFYDVLLHIFLTALTP